jgi:tRNA (uracil-5-)-methyltransferase TRM9
MERADADLAALDEQLHVHDVYNNIADHFSRTRYKVRLIPLHPFHFFFFLQNTQPWPRVSQFIDSLPSGTIGLDAGAGNGKYLGVNSVLASDSPRGGCLIVGLDRYVFVSRGKRSA